MYHRERCALIRKCRPLIRLRIQPFAYLAMVWSRYSRICKGPLYMYQALEEAINVEGCGHSHPRITHGMTTQATNFDNFLGSQILCDNSKWMSGLGPGCATGFVFTFVGWYIHSSYLPTGRYIADSLTAAMTPVSILLTQECICHLHVIRDDIIARVYMEYKQDVWEVL